MSDPRPFAPELVSVFRSVRTPAPTGTDGASPTRSEGPDAARERSLEPWLRTLRVGPEEVATGTQPSRGATGTPRPWDLALETASGPSPHVVVGALDLAVRLGIDPATLSPPPTPELLVPPHDRPRLDVRLASRRWRRVGRRPTGTVWRRSGGDHELVVHDRLLIRGWNTVPLGPFLERTELRSAGDLRLRLLAPDASWACHWLLAGAYLLDPAATPPLQLAHAAILGDAVDPEAAARWGEKMELWRAASLWRALQDVQQWLRNPDDRPPPVPGLGEPEAYRGTTPRRREELGRAARFQDGSLSRLKLVLAGLFAPSSA